MAEVVRTWEEQLARQEDLEDVGVTRGRERFLKALRKAQEKGRPTQVGGAHSLLLKALGRIEEGIAEWITLAEGKRGTRPLALKWIKALDKDVLAYLTIKVLLDGMATPRSLYALSQGIAQCVEDELVYSKLKADRPALFQYLTTNKFLTQHYQYNARMLKGAVKANVIDVAHLRMTKNEKLHVGTKLIDLVISTTGLFRAELVNLARGAQSGRKFRRNSKRDQWQIVAEPETVQWIEEKNELLQWLYPMAVPMVVPPIPWTRGGEPGGYRFGLRGKFDMVRGVSPDQQAVAKAAHIPLVYQALNQIQSTPWRINRGVLGVVEAIEERGGGLAGIPKLEPEPLPAKPQDIETNRESRKAWRKLAHATITRNTIRTHEALKWKRILREADLLRDEETLFFPHNLDFRGRIYPIATHLSPQGDDLSKGLLTFAEGKPIGAEGAKALAVHGANCMDTTPMTGTKLGHLSLDERYQWIRSQSKAIASCASDPIGDLWWTDAAEPLQFLAFCFEWAQYMKHGDSYVCALPIHIDGSCNGLQHFSAMFLDEVGGEAVNLIPTAVPQDIYQRICDTVTGICRAVPDDDPDVLLARRWLSSGLLTRKLTKRPTMTFGYGSKVFGFQDQLVEYLSTDLRETWQATKDHFTVNGSAQTLQACRLLSRYIWTALQQNVVKAFEGMEWLQKSARDMVKATHKGVTWVVPGTGFPVKQEYYHQEKRAVATILAGRVIKPRLYHATNRPLVKKQMNGASPNVVHSLDAAALVLTVDRATKAGVTCFAAIHDSYGTVPGDMAHLAHATREAFVDLYTSRDVAKELHTQFQKQVGTITVLDAPPIKGALALAEVRASLYFFS